MAHSFVPTCVPLSSQPPRHPPSVATAVSPRHCPPPPGCMRLVVVPPTSTRSSRHFFVPCSCAAALPKPSVRQSRLLLLLLALVLALRLEVVVVVVVGVDSRSEEASAGMLCMSCRRCLGLSLLCVYLPACLSACLPGSIAVQAWACLCFLFSFVWYLFVCCRCCRVRLVCWKGISTFVSSVLGGNDSSRRGTLPYVRMCAWK